MAIKDWKLIGRKLGRMRNIIEWINIKNHNFITYVSSTNTLFIRKGKAELDNDVIIKQKKFKTKTQALKFAKAYMRKH
tara:strand:- start:4847 stop:5080 length:234 start_codon:yes stop_codon:yes gene_type:complete